MRLLHVANMEPERSTGPNVSVTSLSAALNRLANVNSAIVDPRASTSHLEPADLCVFHGIWSSEFWSTARECEKLGRPYIIAPRSSLTRGAMKRNLRYKMRAARPALHFVRNAAALHFLTTEEANNSFRVGRPYFVAPNGVSAVESVNGDGNNPSAPSGDLDAPYLLFLGRLDIRHKGLDLAIDALGRIKQELRVSGYRIMIAGDDFNGGGKRLASLIRARGLQDLVEVHSRRFTGTGKRRVISGAAGFFHTSRYEGEPQAVLEALSLGVPALVTRGTNLIGTVTDNGLGVGVETRPRAIAAGFLQLLRQIDNGQFRTHGNWDAIRKRTWDVVASITLEGYREAIEGFRRRSGSRTSL